MIRLGDLLEVDHLGLDLSACANSRDTWVRWVHSAEDIRDLERLRGGEMVVSTGRWRSDPAAADRFACALTRHGAAALGLTAKRGEDLIDVVSACERWRLPLVEIHAPTTCEAVAEVATSMIVDRRSASLAETFERERLFASSSVSSIRGTLDVLQRGMRHPVMLVTRGGVHLPTGGSAPHPADLRLLATTCARTTGTLEIPLSHAGIASAFAVERAHGTAAHGVARLVCCCALAELERHAVSLLEQVVLFLGLQIRHVDEMRVLRRRAESALMRRILADEAAPDEVEGWARDLAIEARGAVTCIVIRRPAMSAVRARDFSDALDDLADAVDVPHVSHQDPDYVGVALVADPHAIEGAVQRFRVLSGEPILRADAHVGTSSVVASSISDVARAFVQASQVARLESFRDPRTQPDAEPIASSLAVLMLQTDDDARRSLNEVLLEPLRLYGEQHGFDPIETLDVFLRCNGHWKEAAAELGVHVNTVRYRITRIEDITGRDLSTMRDRVDFFVAIRSQGTGDGPTGRQS